MRLFLLGLWRWFSHEVPLLPLQRTWIDFPAQVPGTPAPGFPKASSGSYEFILLAICSGKDEDEDDQRCQTVDQTFAQHHSVLENSSFSVYSTYLKSAVNVHAESNVSNPLVPNVQTWIGVIHRCTVPIDGYTISKSCTDFDTKTFENYLLTFWALG